MPIVLKISFLYPKYPKNFQLVQAALKEHKLSLAICWVAKSPWRPPDF